MSISEQAVSAPQTPGAAKIYGVVLSVGIVCALAIVGVYEVTKPIIRRNQIEFRQRAVLAVLPGATNSKAFLANESDGFTEAPADVEGGDVVFAGYDDNGRLVGLALTTQGTGYQDVIQVMYGYSFEQQAVIGTSVLKSLETPGLGDRIEKDENYLRNFEKLDVSLDANGAELAHTIEFVKPGEKTDAWQIDGITGATISSRAMAEMLKTSTAEWMPRVYPRQADFAGASQEED